MTQIKADIDSFSMSWEKRSQRKGPLRRFISRILPDHLIAQMKFEFHMLFVRIRTLNAARAFKGKSDLLVNVGAGGAGKEGWINLDGFMAKGVNCLYDARKRLPFPDCSVKAIFCEHFFEHIDYNEEVPSFLAECFRVLQDGGFIRIIVPDVQKYLEAYTNGGWDLLKTIRPLSDENRDHYFHFKYNTRMELLNVIFRQSQEHKFAYDFETIEFLLRQHRFTEISNRRFGESACPDLCIDTEGRSSESLYAEAIKRSV